MKSLSALASLVVVVALVAAAGAQSGAAQLTDQQIFDKFVAWVRKLPPEAHQHPDRVEADYRTLLASEGLSAAEIERNFRVIDEFERKSDVDTWNRILTAPMPSFNTKPNAFLVEMTRSLTPAERSTSAWVRAATRCISPSTAGPSPASIPPTRPSPRRGPMRSGSA